MVYFISEKRESGRERDLLSDLQDVSATARGRLAPLESSSGDCSPEALPNSATTGPAPSSLPPVFFLKRSRGQVLRRRREEEEEEEGAAVKGGPEEEEEGRGRRGGRGIGSNSEDVSGQSAGELRA